MRLGFNIGKLCNKKAVWGYKKGLSLFLKIRRFNSIGCYAVFIVYIVNMSIWKKRCILTSTEEEFPTFS
jgi:hypothetical protein